MFGPLALLAVVHTHQAPAPILWLPFNGQPTVEGRPVKVYAQLGTMQLRQNGETVYDFNGKRCGLQFGDLKPLRLTGSITVSTWLFLRSYVNDGPGAQILFRGDDRCGHDPYFFVVEGDGTVNFAIQNDDDQMMKVKAEFPLHQWIHVTGSFDVTNGQMKLWLDDELVATAKTSRRPFENLQPSWTPGVSVGNVQNDQGPHNQPLNGQVADLRLYDAVLSPGEAGYEPRPTVQPPVLQLLGLGPA